MLVGEEATHAMYTEHQDKQDGIPGMRELGGPSFLRCSVVDFVLSAPGPKIGCFSSVTRMKFGPTPLASLRCNI